MSVQITSLREEHLQPAAELASRRVKALRQALPVLSPQYEHPGVVLAQLADLCQKAEGVAALQDGRLVGFMSGLVIPEFLGRRAAYSPDWANGVELQESRRIYEEMYACLAQSWVADGCSTHLVSLLANDQAGRDAWHWLGFGLVNVDAVRGLESLRRYSARQVTVRRAGVDDLQVVSELDEALKQHLASSPAFWQHETRDFGEWLEGPGNAAWLAYQQGKVAGFMALEPGATCECALLRDAGTAHITGAFTREAWRGQGIATALLDSALQWAQEDGYLRCGVDFESMNVLATRFWLRWFQPVSYSLVRTLG